MAAGGTPGAVQLGPGRLYVAPLGTAEPTSASAALPSAWRAIGYTEEGSAFSTELTNEAIEVAEEVDPIRYVLTRRSNMLALSMAEVTRQNLGLALGDATAAHAANGPTAFEPPDPGAEAACMIVWDRLDVPTVSNVRWLFRQAKAGGTIEIAARKAPAKSLIAVTFSLEKPATSAPWRVFPNVSGHIR
jgi:hypothetical protein